MHSLSALVGSTTEAFNDKKMLPLQHKKVQLECYANAQKHSRLSAMIFIMKMDEVPELSVLLA